MNELETAKAYTALSHELLSYRTIVKDKLFKADSLKRQLRSYVNPSNPIKKYQVADNEVLVVQYVTPQYTSIIWEPLNDAGKDAGVAPVVESEELLDEELVEEVDVPVIESEELSDKELAKMEKALRNLNMPGANLKLRRWMERNIQKGESSIRGYFTISWR